MATNKELEKRIKTLEKEVQHLKAILQYQMRNKKKWLLLNSTQLVMVWQGVNYLMFFDT